MENKISKLLYDRFQESIVSGEYVNHICDIRCALGSIKEFKVDGTNLTIKLRCSQIGGMFSGNKSFELP